MISKKRHLHNIIFINTNFNYRGLQHEQARRRTNEELDAQHVYLEREIERLQDSRRMLERDVNKGNRRRQDVIRREEVLRAEMMKLDEERRDFEQVKQRCEKLEAINARLLTWVNELQTTILTREEGNDMDNIEYAAAMNRERQRRYRERHHACATRIAALEAKVATLEALLAQLIDGQPQSFHTPSSQVILATSQTDPQAKSDTCMPPPQLPSPIMQACESSAQETQSPRDVKPPPRTTRRVKASTQPR